MAFSSSASASPSSSSSSVRRLAALGLLLAGAATAQARIHSLTIEKDPRFVFSIESFGFLAGGTVRLDLKNVKVTPTDGPAHVLGFVIMPNLQTESTINEYISMLDREKVCAMNVAPSSALVVNVSDPSVWAEYSVPAEVTGPGMYELLFTHCSPTASSLPPGVAGPVTVSFELEATFQNPDGSYLSAGDMPLPGIYGATTVLFALACGVWVWWLRKNRADTYKLHHLMTLLVAVKAFQLLTEAVMYHYIAVTGHNSAWNVMFYIFSLLKGLIMVVVTLLVATGWSIMRPFLSQKEKKILLFAVAIQLLANTAIIVTDEIAPGSLTYLEWSDLFRITDIIASVAIILPIHWGIKSLEAAQASGAANSDDGAKAAETLSRLRALQKFYYMTILYVYLTRLLLWILSQGLPFNMTWVSPAAEEFATLAYFVATGFYFRPSVENAYLRVSQDDDESPEDATGKGARATGAAAGTVEGSAPVVQTIEMARRGGGGGAGVTQTVSASDSAPSSAAASGKAGKADADDWDDGPAASGRAAAGAKGKAAAAGAVHQVGDEFDDDEDFGLDELDEEEGGGAGAARGGGGGAPAPKPASGGLKQVRKERD